MHRVYITMGVAGGRLTPFLHRDENPGFWTGFFFFFFGACEAFADSWVPAGIFIPVRRCLFLSAGSKEAVSVCWGW